MYQDLSARHGQPVKNRIVELPIRMKENSKTISGNSSSPHGSPEQGYPLLNGVRLRLWRRLLYGVFPGVLGKNSLGPRDPKRRRCAE